MKKYIISAKRIIDIFGELIPKNQQYYEYGCCVSHDYRSDFRYYSFGTKSSAIYFNSVEEARHWFDNAKKELSHYQCYDWDTLAIREVIYKTTEKLSF